jgi:hypothetical protein
MALRAEVVHALADVLKGDRARVMLALRAEG